MDEASTSSAAPAAHALVRAMLEESTQADPGSLSSDMVLKEIEGWDSMGMVLFIALVQERMQIELSVHDLRESASVGDLERRVASLGGSKA